MAKKSKTSSKEESKASVKKESVTSTKEEFKVSVKDQEGFIDFILVMMGGGILIGIMFIIVGILRYNSSTTIERVEEKIKYYISKREGYDRENCRPGKHHGIPDHGKAYRRRLYQ
jgi:hypothetical protein